MAVESDKQFQELLGQFELEYKRRGRSINSHMNQATRILEDLRLATDVRHTPILARQKDVNRARDTLKRRQKERLKLEQLKNRVLARGQSWEPYCAQWRIEGAREVGSFQTVDQMFAAMHDLAGIRISLYFPNDAMKVIKFVRENFSVIQGPSPKGGLARDFKRIRKLVEREEREDDNESEDVGWMHDSTPTDYRATHMVVRHRNLDFDPFAKHDPFVAIEIQIGSIIMHAWSDIEHDILYKPTDTEEKTPEMVSTLRLINSIVTLGEDALRQLESASASQAKRQAKDRTKKALNYHHMVPWLDKYCTDNKVSLPLKHEWRSMLYLFELLEATGEHTYGRIEQLLKEISPQPEHLFASIKPAPPEHLPTMILQQLGKDTYPFGDPPAFKPSELATTWNARYWATRFVNFLNLATYMNATAAVQSALKHESCKQWQLHEKRPTVAEFLDILHPSEPKRRPNLESEMIRFCEQFLRASVDWLEENHSLLAALKLTSADYVVRPRFSREDEKALSSWEEQSLVIVPSLLIKLAYDSAIGYNLFPIAMCAFGDDCPPWESDTLYFIPSQTGTWKPVTRMTGYDWVILRCEFLNDHGLDFPINDLDDLQHLCRVLDFSDRSIFEVLSRVTTLVEKFHLEQHVEDIRRLIKKGSALDSNDIRELDRWYKAEKFDLAAARQKKKKAKGSIRSHVMKSLPSV